MTGAEIVNRLRLGRSTVATWLTRMGLGRRAAREPGPPVRRYQRERPGDLIHLPPEEKPWSTTGLLSARKHPREPLAVAVSVALCRRHRPRSRRRSPERPSKSVVGATAAAHAPCAAADLSDGLRQPAEGPSTHRGEDVRWHHGCQKLSWCWMATRADPVKSHRNRDPRYWR